MFQYLVRRLIQAIPILIGVSVIVFLIVYAAPGDPTDRFRTPRVPPEQIEALIRSYGLDRSLPEQYLAWVTTFFQVGTPRPGATASRMASRSWRRSCSACRRPSC